MKKTIMILMAGIFMIAFNNSGNSESSTSDSITLPDNNDDRNNRNTTVYDSATGKPQGDTASYEGIPNKVSDSASK
jgi:hypothetical protein